MGSRIYSIDELTAILNNPDSDFDISDEEDDTNEEFITGKYTFYFIIVYPIHSIFKQLDVISQTKNLKNSSVYNSFRCSCRFTHKKGFRKCFVIKIKSIRCN
jgi:hypothetical protein